MDESILKMLERIEKLLAQKSPKSPIDQTIMLSDGQGWQMDYRGRKHVFLWSPEATNLKLGEYGTGPIQAQVWINLGIRTGIKIFTSGQATPVPVVLRFTDEVIP